jgi:hypothetical protein
LKQTQSEKGSVTKTRAHEMAVKSHPQSPIPLSDSSAARKERKEHEFLIFRKIFFIIVEKLK